MPAWSTLMLGVVCLDLIIASGAWACCFFSVRDVLLLKAE